jgi:hypothetical protein
MILEPSGQSANFNVDHQLFVFGLTTLDTLRSRRLIMTGAQQTGSDRPSAR